MNPSVKKFRCKERFFFTTEFHGVALLETELNLFLAQVFNW